MRSVPKGVLPCMLGLLALSGSLASTQETSRESVANVSYSSTEIYFQPRLGGAAWSVRVIGPGGFVLERRSPGSPPSISVFDGNGQSLPDGSYTYELRAEVAVGPSAVERLDHETAAGRSSALRPGVPARELPAVFGGFRIAGGSIVVPQANEPGPRAPHTGRSPQAATETARHDVVHADDLIVLGSTCVGFDCVDGEIFGFDTIRLKENNLRIRFDDTSATAGFPANDWQLVANDSASGGASKFSIEDATAGRTPFTIRAGAPDNSVFVDSSGRLGLKTATPVLDVHAAVGDTPALRLEQTGSSGWTPQTWDVAGNEANFFVRDATGGSRLPFRIVPGAPTSSIFISSSGGIGLGTSSPTTDLHVRAKPGSAGNAELLLDSGAARWKWRSNGTNAQMNLIDEVNAKVVLRIAQGSRNNLLELGVKGTDRVDITGQLFINNFSNSTPDYVFEPDYELESIEEHARLMWQNRHLPALAPAEITAHGETSFDVGARSQAVLEELEKAHIYIEQLNARVKALATAIERKDAALAELRAEIETVRQQRQ
jgi:hypothetical protein